MNDSISVILLLILNHALSSPGKEPFSITLIPCVLHHLSRQVVLLPSPLHCHVTCKDLILFMAFIALCFCLFYIIGVVTPGLGSKSQFHAHSAHWSHRPSLHFDRPSFHFPLKQLCGDPEPTSPTMHPFASVSWQPLLRTGGQESNQPLLILQRELCVCEHQKKSGLKT